MYTQSHINALVLESAYDLFNNILYLLDTQKTFDRHEEETRIEIKILLKKHVDFINKANKEIINQKYISPHNCNKSPDGYCHYFSDKDDIGRFVYINDAKYYLLDNKESEIESFDSCIFCEEPYDRR